MDILEFIVGIIALAIGDHSSGYSCIQVRHPPGIMGALTS